MGNLAPSASTMASLTLGGAVSILVAWALLTFWQITLGPMEQSAVSTIITVLCGLFFKGGLDVHVNPPTNP